MDRTLIKNARVITPEGIIEGGSILIEGSIISQVSKTDICAEDCQTIDAGGAYASPGFIDLHTHGAGGCDFMDNTPEAYLEAARMHAQHGTTALCPTTLTSTIEELKDTLRVYKEAKKQNTCGSDFIGLHLEGPYFALSQKGAQDPKFIKNPDADEYKKILEWSDDIVRWSAAPELEGALEFARYISARGILPSIAHTDAVYEQVAKAYECGFTHVTHLYSAMSGVRRINAYRYAGVIESAYLIDDMTVEIIADGSHLPVSLLQLIYKIKGPERIALITDSMRAAGMPEGESILGSLKAGQKVIVEDGVAKMPDRVNFAGSVATGDILVRTMVKKAGISVFDAVRMASETPARIIRISDKKGSIKAGLDADISIFDDEIKIKAVIIKGKLVHTAQII